jgi:hypothetical protein
MSTGRSAAARSKRDAMRPSLMSLLLLTPCLA